MAQDLSNLNWENGGANATVSIPNTNNVEITIPKWCKLITIIPTGQAIYFAYDGTDGASPISARFPHPVSAIIQYNPVQTAQTRKIYVAAQTGSAAIFLLFE
tara:strand:- start:223 stop:528 length:306 start_codon:yes stop_codon:yes gene_type:complete